MKFNTTVLSLVAALTTNAALADWQALPGKAPEPADNPTTPEKVELGRMLYFDPRFSETGTVSCNSCHNLMLGGVMTIAPFPWVYTARPAAEVHLRYGTRRFHRPSSGVDGLPAWRIRPRGRS